MKKQFTYCSALASDYLAVMRVLLRYKIPFEWHSKYRGCGRCYLDFTLDNEENPPLDQIQREASEVVRHKGKTLDFKIISTYEY